MIFYRRVAQNIDFFTSVTSPGGYIVPVQDFTMSSSLAETDGEVTTQNNRGFRVSSPETPSDATFDFTVTATG